MTQRRGFDRLSRVYRALEFVAFGSDLQRARLCFLDRLRGCTNILILGDGDGRGLEQIVLAAPAARIRSIDASIGMLTRARQRIGDTSAATRIHFEHADARHAVFPRSEYDAVITLFFLDCFRSGDVTALVERVQPSVRPGAFWLFADFAMPAHGWPRLRARVWLAGLYQFFRWQTGIDAKALPPSEDILRRAGWQPTATHDLQRGFIRSALFTRGSPPAASRCDGSLRQPHPRER